MAALNLCRFKNGTANARAAPRRHSRMSGHRAGGGRERLAIASALRDPRRGSPRPALDSLLRGPPGHQRGQPDPHLRAAARSASAARSADQGTRPRDVPDLGAPGWTQTKPGRRARHETPPRHGNHQRHLHVPTRRKSQMRQIRHTRRRPGPASEQQSPLPADSRDPDIVHAHQVARRTSRSRARRAQPDRRTQPTPIPGSR